jgi:hypothetical protein
VRAEAHPPLAPVAPAVADGFDDVEDGAGTSAAPAAPVTCEQVAAVLPGTPDLLLVDPAARAHVRACPRCQADLDVYRRLRAALARLRAERVDPGPEAVDAALAAVHAGLRSARRLRRVAYGALGGLAAATAGAAGAWITVSRARRGHLAG